MTDSDPIVVCGRAFSTEDLATIRAIIALPDLPNRRQIATIACERLGWKRIDGRLKEMSCRVALIRLEKLGLIRLPPPTQGNANGKAYVPKQTLDRPLFSLPDTVGAIDGLRLRLVEDKADSRLWNEAVSRFHYLGYQPLPGAQMRYLAECSTGLLAAIGFGASAWKVAPRDTWIGWSHEQRKRGLHLVVNNARFLILPWVKVRNLASWILGSCSRRLPSDFESRYAYRPVLLETFVDAARFRGTCYAAANWQYLGDTTGRGKLDCHHLAALPVKKIYVRPLTDAFREVLCAPGSGP
jgi:hypothetical protein